MLPPENRLRLTHEYRSTVRRGIRIGRPLVVVHVIPGTDDDSPTRVGFVVGRSVGGAVVRNAVRRRLRHLLRDRLEQLPVGSRVVIRAQPAAASAPGTALARDLDDALDRALPRVGVRS
ncbi:MAG TPA: ribonuclease P protein component [Jiangellaceae bacterium]|nr:ribonuclease P protein component [Jiangellaceae bacterium]